MFSFSSTHFRRWTWVGLLREFLPFSKMAFPQILPMESLVLHCCSHVTGSKGWFFSAKLSVCELSGQVHKVLFDLCTITRHSLSISIKMGVQMFVCLLVCKGLMEIQTPTPIWLKFCTPIPTCPRKVLVQVWPTHPPPWAWRKHFWKLFTNKGCSAGCKFIRAGQGTSASQVIKITPLFAWQHKKHV